MSEEITPDLILEGYRIGVFPMADRDGSVYWYSPDPRCVLEFNRFHVPRTVRQLVRRQTFEVRLDTAFDRVIAACADRPEGTWISSEIITLYTELHRRGCAHTVETWQAGRLAGGLYGIALGGAFFGESMFHRVTNASKVALVALMDHLRRRRYTLVDTQWITPHLARFGATEIPRPTYLRRLNDALQLPCTFCDRPGLFDTPTT